MSRKITKDDVQKKLNTLSIDELIGMLNTYSKATGEDISVGSYLFYSILLLLII